MDVPVHIWAAVIVWVPAKIAVVVRYDVVERMSSAMSRRSAVGECCSDHEDDGNVDSDCSGDVYCASRLMLGWTLRRMNIGGEG